MLALDYKKGQKPVKQGLSVTPFLRGGKGRKEERCQRLKTRSFYTFWGGIKSGQEVVPAFWGPTFSYFLNLLKPYFKAFPGKVGGRIFFENSMLEKGPTSQKSGFGGL